MGFGLWGLGADLSPIDIDVVMSVEATTCFRLDPTSILDVHKVFWHHDMV